MFDIRPATIEDAQELRDLAEKTWVDTFGHTVTEETKNAIMAKTRSIEYIRYSIENIPTLLAISQNDNSIIGYVQLSKLDKEITEMFDTSPDDRQVDRLYVDTKHQGKRIGTTLLQTALDLPYIKEAKDLYLSVDKYNEKAQKLYKKFGFEDSGKEIIYEAVSGPALIDAVFVKTKL